MPARAAVMPAASDVARVTTNTSTAVRRASSARPRPAGCAASGRISPSASAPRTRFTHVTRRSSRDVAEPLELLLDLLFGVRPLELGELLLEDVGDELLDR